MSSGQELVLFHGPANTPRLDPREKPVEKRVHLRFGDLKKRDIIQLHFLQVCLIVVHSVTTGMPLNQSSVAGRETDVRGDVCPVPLRRPEDCHFSQGDRSTKNERRDGNL